MCFLYSFSSFVQNTTHSTAADANLNPIYCVLLPNPSRRGSYSLFFLFYFILKPIHTTSQKTLFILFCFIFVFFKFRFVVSISQPWWFTSIKEIDWFTRNPFSLKRKLQTAIGFSFGIIWRRIWINENSIWARIFSAAAAPSSCCQRHHRHVLWLISNEWMGGTIVSNIQVTKTSPSCQRVT